MQKSRVTSGSSLSSRSSSMAQIASISRTGSTTGRYAGAVFHRQPDDAGQRGHAQQQFPISSSPSSHLISSLLLRSGRFPYRRNSSSQRKRRSDFLARASSPERARPAARFSPPQRRPARSRRRYSSPFPTDPRCAPSRQNRSARGRIGRPGASPSPRQTPFPAPRDRFRRIVSERLLRPRAAAIHQREEHPVFVHLADFVRFNPHDTSRSQNQTGSGCAPRLFCAHVHVVDHVVQPRRAATTSSWRSALRSMICCRPPHEGRVVRLAQQREIIRQRRKSGSPSIRIVELKPPSPRCTGPPCTACRAKG